MIPKDCAWRFQTEFFEKHRCSEKILVLVIDINGKWMAEHGTDEKKTGYNSRNYLIPDSGPIPDAVCFYPD